MSIEHSPAGKSPAAWVLFAAVFAVGLAADLWSKAAVFDWIGNIRPHQFTREIIPSVMNFTLSTNPGVAFGFRLPPWAVLIATGVAFVVVIVFFVTSPRRARFTQIALAMIAAGAMGNLYDRLFSRVILPGRGLRVREVRDFVDLSAIHYPAIFNIADVLLVVGVGILMLAALAQWYRERAEKAA